MPKDAWLLMSQIQSSMQASPYSSGVETHGSGQIPGCLTEACLSLTLKLSFSDADSLKAWISHNWIVFPTQLFLLLLPTLALLVSSAVLEPWRKSDLQNAVLSVPSPWKSPSQPLHRALFHELFSAVLSLMAPIYFHLDPYCHLKWLVWFYGLLPPVTM